MMQLKDKSQKFGKVNSVIRSKKISNKLLQRFSAYNAPKASFRRSDASFNEEAIVEDNSELTG